MKKKNGGYSLVELIIVIAIMSIIAGLAVAGIGSVSGMRSTSCAKKIVAYMNEAKTENASFDETDLKLGYDSSNGYKATLVNVIYDFGSDATLSVDNASRVETTLSPEYVGHPKVSVTVKIGGVYYDLKTNEVIISFDSGSGSFKPANVKTYAGTNVVAVSDKKYVEEIKIVYNSRTTIIKCDKLTGKFYIQ